MSGEPTTRPADGIRTLDVVLSIWVLFVLALAQPLLDLLGRNAEFFLARSAPPLDIILLAVSLTIVLPLMIGFLVVGVRRIHEPTGRIFHGLVLASLAGLLALQIIELTALSNASPWIELALAIGAGRELQTQRPAGVVAERHLDVEPAAVAEVDQTLTDAEIDAVAAKIVANVAKSTDGVLRG